MSVRAIATRCELGASAALIYALHSLEIFSCYGVGTDAVALARASDILVVNLASGAGLDVFWSEPDIDQPLLEFPNVIVQPHQSSGTVETRKAMGQLVLDDVAAHFANLPLLTPVV